MSPLGLVQWITSYGSREGQSKPAALSPLYPSPRPCGAVRRRLRATLRLAASLRTRVRLAAVVPGSCRSGAARARRESGMGAAEADHWAWLLVLSFVFGCNVLRILLPSFSSFVSDCLALQGPAESAWTGALQSGLLRRGFSRRSAFVVCSVF